MASTTSTRRTPSSPNAAWRQSYRPTTASSDNRGSRRPLGRTLQTGRSSRRVPFPSTWRSSTSGTDCQGTTSRGTPSRTHERGLESLRRARDGDLPYDSDPTAAFCSEFEDSSARARSAPRSGGRRGSAEHCEELVRIRDPVGLHTFDEHPPQEVGEEQAPSTRRSGTLRGKSTSIRRTGAVSRTTPRRGRT